MVKHGIRMVNKLRNTNDTWLIWLKRRELSSCNSWLKIWYPFCSHPNAQTVSTHSHISCAVLNPTINRPRTQNTNGWDWNPSPNHGSCLLWRKFYYINHWFETFKKRLNSSPEVLNGPETFAPRLVLLRQPSTRPARVASSSVADTQRSPVEVSAAVKAAEFGLHVTPLIIISKRIGYDWIIQRKPPVTMSFLALSHYFMPISSKTRWTAAPNNCGAHPDHGRSVTWYTYKLRLSLAWQSTSFYGTRVVIHVQCGVQYQLADR
jgi:hypothetical protein